MGWYGEVEAAEKYFKELRISSQLQFDSGFAPCILSAEFALGGRWHGQRLNAVFLFFLSTTPSILLAHQRLLTMRHVNHQCHENNVEI